MMVEENPSKLREELHNFVVSYYQYQYGVEDGMLKIQKAYGGKPYVVINDRIVNRNFNISHTSGAGVVVFSDFSIGIDIEKIDDVNLKIAQRFFVENEQRYIFEVEDGSEQRKRFFEIWTKKEAYWKCDGRGLVGGIQNVNVLEKKYAYQQIEICESQYAMAVYIKQTVAALDSILDSSSIYRIDELSK